MAEYIVRCGGHECKLAIVICVWIPRPPLLLSLLGYSSSPSPREDISFPPKSAPGTPPARISWRPTLSRNRIFPGVKISAKCKH